MLELLTTGSRKIVPHSQFNLLTLEVLSVPNKVLTFNVLGAEVLTTRDKVMQFNLNTIETLSLPTGA